MGFREVFAMELREALQQISDIRACVARSEVFRGYRALTVGFSGALGIFAAAFQSRIVGAPVTDLRRYLTLWLAVAAIV